MDNYQINIGGSEFSLDSKTASELDMLNPYPDTFHVLENGISYTIKVLSKNLAKKELILEVNGSKYPVKIEDSLDLMIKKMGLSAGTAKKLSVINSPMPGLILDILVKEGDTIEKGSQLLILEAMKMENILKADGDGVVKSIEVSKGNAVEKGQLLIDLV